MFHPSRIPSSIAFRSGAARAFAFTAALALSVGDAGAAGNLRRQGRTLVDDQGTVLLKGFNVGNWLVQEGYLMHVDIAGYKSPSELRAKVADLVGGAAKAEEFFAAWRDNFFTEEDVKALKASGGNSFRIPFHYKEIFDAAGRRPIPAGFKYLDSCVAWGERHQVHMILDMHVAPGGQNHMEHSDVPAEPNKLFAGTNGDFDHYAAITAQTWKAVADRYKARTHVTYNLINEPLVADQALHWRLEQVHRRITDTIRKVDKVHLIIAEGNWWGSWLQPLGARWDENMAFSTHNYWTKVPDVKRSGQVDWSVQQNTPIWHGETGENSNAWYNIERRDLEAKGIGWSWWTWKKIEGISGGYTTAAIPASYQAIVRHWKGEDAKPDPEAALAGLLELAASTNISACRKNWDVFDALFRADHHLKGAPYANVLRDIPENPNTWSTRLKAAEYDMGAPGIAYADSAVMSVSMHKDSAVAWNQGWLYRNDGVDVFMDWSAWEPYVGGTSPGEWVGFTVNVVKAGPHKLVFNAATPEPGRRVLLEVDGVRMGGDIAIPATGDWANWTDIEGPTVTLKQGRQTLRILFPVGQINLRALEIFSLEPPVSLSGRLAAAAPSLDLLAWLPAAEGAWLAYRSGSSGEARIEVFGLRGDRRGEWTVKLEQGSHRIFLPGLPRLASASPETGLTAATVSVGGRKFTRMFMR